MAEWVLVVSLGGALYFLAGYPLLLWLGRFRVHPIEKDLNYAPTATVLMAVYNGEEFLESKLQNLLSLAYPRDKLQILVVSDGSTDQTDQIAERFACEGIRLLRVKRGGKAAAVNTGLAEATGEVVLFCDVRQKLEADALRKLVANLADPNVGAVTGELRILLPGKQASEQESLGLYWRYELWARRRQSEVWSLFNVTGCLYAMRRSLLGTVPPDTLADDIAFPMMAYWRGLRIVSEPEAVATDFPTAAGGEFRRRMRTLSGAWQMWSRQPELLFRPHRMWLHFVSHKLGRLLLPWLLLASMVASALLPASGWKWAILAGWGGLFLAALTNGVLPAGFPGKRLTSLASTFLTMNAAALLSVQVFFVPAGRMWRGPTRVEMGHRPPKE